MNDVFKPAGQNTTATRSYMSPSIWNKPPDFLKEQRTSTRTNTELKSSFAQNEQHL